MPINTLRTAVDKNGKAVLFILLGPRHVESLKYWKLEDHKISHWIFFYIFEMGFICGSSGAHECVEEMKIGTEEKKSPGGELCFSAGVRLSISLKNYEQLRLRRPKKSPCGKEYDPFPTVSGLGG